MSLFDDPTFSERLFFPRPDRSPLPPGARDESVTVDGAVLHVRIHAGAGPTLLLFHGNGEVVADYDSAAPQFAEIGARLAVCDYRGYGQSTGTPSLRSMIEDSLAIVAAVNPVLVMGRSVGSACAAEIYARNLPGIAGVIVESGSSDLAGLVKRRGFAPPAAFSAEDSTAFDPVGKYARGTQPLLVLHGAQDSMIAPREADATFAAAGTTAKRLVIVPSRGHNDISFSTVYWDALRRFVSETVSADR